MDVTTATFAVANADVERVRKMLFSDPVEVLPDEYPIEDGITSFTLMEASNGGEEVVDAMQAAGIPVWVKHDSGGSCGPGEIAFDGTFRACAEGRRRSDSGSQVRLDRLWDCRGALR